MHKKSTIYNRSINQYAFEGTTYINIISVIFFWLNIAIAGFAFYAMIKMCIRKCSAEPAEKMLFVGFYVTMITVFYKNAAAYPFVCTMNFRYITTIVIIGAVFIGLSLNIKSNCKLLNDLLSASAAIFSAMGMMIYLSIS